MTSAVQIERMLERVCERLPADAQRVLSRRNWSWDRSLSRLEELLNRRDITLTRRQYELLQVGSALRMYQHLLQRPRTDRRNLLDQTQQELRYVEYLLLHDDPSH